MFRPAVKEEAKLRMAIAGPSGSGKTYTALQAAEMLAGPEGASSARTVAVVDTEHGSASKYADLFAFDVVNFSAPFHPSRFVEAIHSAEDAGYKVLVIDSISHAWNGAGGLLEIVDTASRKYKGNTYMAWSEGTPLQNRLVEAIVGADLHLIVTMRSKQDYVLVEVNGKQVPRKVGMAPIQRDGFEYEFDIFLDMDIENGATVSKTRCPALAGAYLPRPRENLVEPLLEWLKGVKPPSQEELLQAASQAEELSSFIYHTHRLEGVAKILETPQRLTDFVVYVAGDYEPEHAGELVAITRSYVDQVANGEKVKEAADRAKDAYQEYLAKALGQKKKAKKG